MVEKTIVSLIVVTTYIITALLSCSHPTNGIAIEQKPEKVYGYLYKDDGIAASGALVTLVKSDYIPSGQGVSKKMITAATTLTNNNGKFAYDNLSAGTYNIFGSTSTSDSASYTPSVNITDADSGVCIVKDTLKPTGCLKGKIQFSPYADSRSALILMLGSTRMTWPEDGLGNFTIANLAEGTYRIRFLPTNPLYSTLDTSFNVFSAETTDVGTINLLGQQFDTLGSDTIVLRARSSVIGTWGPNKTFKIMCNVEIPQGQRLEIKEGTHIVFMGKYNFETNGNCIARGTVDNPVIFTYGLNFAGVGWDKFGNISVNDSYGYNDPLLKPDSLVFENCIIEYCNQPHFELNAVIPEFYFEMNNCILRHLQNGIQIQFDGEDWVINNIRERIVIRNCVFHDVQTITTQSGMGDIQPLIDIQNGSLNCTQNTIYQVTNNIFYHEQWREDLKCYFSYNCYDTSHFTSPDPACVFADPMFVNIQKGDYHLMPASPCRGAGLNGEDMGLKFDK